MILLWVCRHISKRAMHRRRFGRQRPQDFMNIWAAGASLQHRRMGEEGGRRQASLVQHAGGKMEKQQQHTAPTCEEHSQIHAGTGKTTQTLQIREADRVLPAGFGCPDRDAGENAASGSTGGDTDGLSWEAETRSCGPSHLEEFHKKKAADEAKKSASSGHSYNSDAVPNEKEPSTIEHVWVNALDGVSTSVGVGRSVIDKLTTALVIL